MALLTTGRTLDANGLPLEGTGFSYDSESRVAELLAQRTSPLISQPVTGEWIIGLSDPDTDIEVQRGMGIFAPGNAGPATHYHPLYEEGFEVLSGDFVFTLDGEDRRVTTGERLTVPRGHAHTFTCIGDEPGFVLAETRPAARVGEVLLTLFGLAHEGKLTRKGQPKAWQGLVTAAEYSDDTVFVSPPPAITVPWPRRWPPSRA